MSIDNVKIRLNRAMAHKEVLFLHYDEAVFLDKYIAKLERVSDRADFAWAIIYLLVFFFAMVFFVGPEKVLFCQWIQK